MTDVNEEVKIETAISVGERLRTAREQKKLTIAEVSAQLRLVRSNIEYLEEGQWEKLHGRAYARGYFSSYVKFLDLPEEEMLTEFAREYDSSVAEPSLGSQKSGKGKGFPWSLFIFVVVVFMAGWFTYPQWQHYFDDYLASINIDQFEAEQSVDNAPAIDSVVEPINDETSVIPAVKEEIVKSTVVEEIEQNQDAPFANLKPPHDLLAIGIDKNITEAEKLESMTRDIVTSNDNIAVEKNISVDLQFSADCWVEVSDASGTVLIKKIMLANTSTTLEGKAPFTVSLGLAPAVIVTVDGVVFDTSPFTQRGVARFKLGEKT